MRRSAPARRVARAAPAALALLLPLAGCAITPSDESAASVAPAGITGELRVYAAASLAAAFDRIAEELEQSNPGLDIRPVVYDGSSTLATQLAEGARADVFASADEHTMALVDGAGLVASAPLAFATNSLVIVVPEGNPGGVTGLGDLADRSLSVALCASEVPCGVASQALLDAASVQVVAASYEQSVTAVLTKVAADEADAGLVYRTEAATRDTVDTIVPEGAADVVNGYRIAALAGAENPRAAAAFVAHVTGPQGRETLAEYGFGAP